MSRHKKRRTSNHQPPTTNLQSLTSVASGRVFLVGAGPGDPGLITVAGLERIREADAIVYDRLANRRLLEHARADAELIFAGKSPGTQSGDEPIHDQGSINRLLIEKAREGKRVVRLKGGDPFVFGRGGEEAEALRAAGIPFEVVPGVTSALAVPAYAGIPLSHRGVASSFVVVTGHEADRSVILSGDDGSSRDTSASRRNPGRGSAGATTSARKLSPPAAPTAIQWDKLATGADTLVFLMGTRTLDEIVDKLIVNGRTASTPVAVIRWGTLPEQRTVVGTLGDIVRRVEEAGLAPPTVTVVGEVVRLRETLSWFEERPLFGRRVLITRTRRQAGALSRLLADEGAIPIELPAIEIEPVAQEAAVEAALARLPEGRYAWAVFTSANAVELLFGLMRERRLDARAFAAASVVAIGPATAEALGEQGIVADVVPAQYIAEGVLEAMRPHLRPGDHVLLPRAESARPELVEGLRAAGAEVDEVVLYRAAVPKEAPAEALSQLREGAIDIVTFTSSSTVRNLAAMLDGDVECLRRPLVTCIGPVTAGTAEELGLRVDVVAEEHTMAGLVRAIRQHCEVADRRMARKASGKITGYLPARPEAARRTSGATELPYGSQS